MTAGEGPGNAWAEHDCGYVPLLTGGRLIKRHDPAWRLPEVGDGRTADALQRHVDARAAHDLFHARPGYGLGYHHSRDPRGEVSGYPDCHMWAPRPGGQMFRELKRMGQAPRPDQVAVLTALAATGADVGVWWPCCWYSGRIDRELAALAGRAPIGGHWAPGLPAQPGQPGHTRPAAPSPAAAVAVPRPRRAGPGRARADQVAPRTAGRPAAAGLPGADPPPRWWAGVTGGYKVPVDVDAATAARLEAWLRAHGFPPAAVPYPVHVALYADGTGTGVAVQCRTGGPGSPRVWRCAAVRRELDDELAAALAGGSIRGGAVVHWLTDAAPSDLAAV